MKQHKHLSTDIALLIFLAGVVALLIFPILGNSALNGVELVIEAKVSATGVTYGSVGAAAVVEALSKKGFDIDRKMIVLHDVKEIGAHKATVKLHKEVSVEIPFEVVAEEA